MSQTTVSVIAKWSRVPGHNDQIDNHGHCPLCKGQNRVRHGPDKEVLHAVTCAHWVRSEFHPTERVFYFSFAAV